MNRVCCTITVMFVLICIVYNKYYCLTLLVFLEGIARGKWILRGTFNQNNPRFSKESRNTQCTANATMALAYSTIKPEREWNTDTIDEVNSSMINIF